MDLIERFQYLMKLQQKTASSFADEIGVQRSSVSHILSGRNKPSLEFIQKVLLKYPKVDANWLINGTPKSEGVPATIESGTEKPKDTSKKVVAPKEDTAKKPTSDAKRIKRILVFYEDQTFEEYSA